MKASELEEIQVIPSGLFIDKLTGIGGIPKGSITEVFGDEGIGKSSLCLQIVASAQKQGLKCLWVDVEWSFTPRYAKDLGVINEDLGLIRERYAEAILDTLEEEIEKGKLDLIVLDSVGGLTPRAEIEKGAEGKVIGAQAGLLARFCRKIVPLLALNNVALIVINHAFVDIMSGKLLTSGGKKLAYHKGLSLRLKLKAGVSLKTGDRKVGKVIIAEIKKNKHASTEGMEGEGQLIFGQAFSVEADLLDEAIQKGLITKKGNTYFFAEKKLGVGMTKAREALKDEGTREELMESLKK